MTRHRGRLTSAQKAFVVQRLACWDSPGEVAAAVKEEFGITISPQACEAYDPTKRAGSNLARHWCELFEVTRTRFREKLACTVPEANRSVRIRVLASMARAAKAAGDFRLAGRLLAAVATEVNCGTGPFRRP